jgi:GTPase SAR1 family protein
MKTKISMSTEVLVQQIRQHLFWETQHSSGKMLITPSTLEAERPSFQIKVALIGYVSVGKTTVLNALFRDTYGEVSMRRTTAGVNEFRVITPKSKWKVVPEEASDSSAGSVSTSSTTNTIVRTADSTLKEISADNVVLRESHLVQKKTFDIELEEELCDMRDDTQLVIVDIPGINEAGASTKYRDYVTDNWHTFDCVVVVTDGRQGVNTEEQLDLLALVEKNSREKKAIPVIILCNKVDEPEDEEQKVLLAEVRQAVERIFGIQDCQGALRKIPDDTEDPFSKKLSPVFVPLSAIHAFIYRTASLMDFEQFKKFGNALIEKLGRDNFWQKQVESIIREEEGPGSIQCP